MIVLIKLGVWLAVGATSICTLLGTTTLETPWRYTLDSTIAPGSQITLTQPDGDPVTMKVPEGQVVSGTKTLDVGAPLSLAAVFALGGITAYVMKGRRRAPGYAQQPG